MYLYMLLVINIMFYQVSWTKNSGNLDTHDSLLLDHSGYPLTR